MALPVPVIVAGVELMSRMAQVEGQARQVELEANKGRLAAMQALALREMELCDAQEQREHQYDMAHLASKTRLESEQMQIDAQDRQSERQMAVLHKFLDIAADFGNQKLAFMQETFAATRDLLASQQKQLLRQHDKYTDALLTVEGPKEVMINARIRDMESQLEELQRAQTKLSEGYTTIISALHPELPMDQRMLKAIPSKIL